MAAATEEKFMVDISDRDSQYYQTWQSVLLQPTMQQLNPDTAKLLDTVAQIGYQHADSKDAYKRDISRYFSLWGEKMQAVSVPPSKNEPKEKSLRYTATVTVSRSDTSKPILHIANLCFSSTNTLPRATSSSKKATVFMPQSCYTKGVARDLRAKSLERQSSKYMKRVIPLSYAILFTIFFSLSVVLGFIFYNGLHTGNYFIGPWTNLMLLIATVGLTITVFAACSEWRRWHSGFFKEKERRKKAGRK